MLKLSVVLVVGEQRERSARGLRSILEQNIIDQIEVLVMDCSVPGTPPLLGSEHPSVRVVRLVQDELYAHTLAEGVRQARAPVVAFMEEHCTALPGWAEALVSAHQGPWAGVGGEIHSANPGLGSSEAVAFTMSEPWNIPGERREVKLLDVPNSAFKREILLEYGDTLDTLLRSDPVLVWKLSQDGHRFLVDPAAKFAHIYVTSLRFFGRVQYVWHRCFGHTRAEVFNWPVGKRALRILVTPLVPWWRVAKRAVQIVWHRPRLLWSFIRNAPLVLIGDYYAAFGQAVGLMFGMGDAEARFSDYERNAYRAIGDSRLATG